MQPYMDASDTLHFARVDFRNDTGVFGIKNETDFRISTSFGKPASASQRWSPAFGAEDVAPEALEAQPSSACVLCGAGRQTALANDQDSHTFRNADASMPKRCYRTILIVLTVACGLGALVTAPIVLLTAAMGFDAPGSEYQVWAWIVFIVVLSIPFWFVIGAIVFGPRPLRR
jgi:hypothetical protein